MLFVFVACLFLLHLLAVHGEDEPHTEKQQQQQQQQQQHEGGFDRFYHDFGKRPLTGFYANENVNRSIVVMGDFFGDSPGGVEALVQLTIALSEAATSKEEVYVSCVGRGNNGYHEKWQKLYGDKLVYRTKEQHTMKPGDVYIYNEGVGCEANIPPGVRVYIYLLASYAGCQSTDVHYLAHNQRLATWDFEHLSVRLPRERVIHPYISEYIIEHAIHRAGLQHDGSILPRKSQLKDLKRNVVLVDNDVPEPVIRTIHAAVKEVGGVSVVVNELSQQQVLEKYEEAKVLVDWCMRGSERCALEASLFGVIAITNNCDTGKEFADFPIPGRWLLPHDGNRTQVDLMYHENDPGRLQLHAMLVDMFRTAFDEYWDHVPSFEPLRRAVITHSPSSMLKEAIHFLGTTHLDDDLGQLPKGNNERKRHR